MDRFATLVTAVALAFAVTNPGARAQEPATLHVRDFTLRADRARVRVGERFHLTVAARVAERLAALDDVALPNLSGFEELGDERQCAPVAGGTACSETLTLAAREPGEQTLEAATLLAVDARTGRPSRFLTNAVAIDVVPDPALRENAIRESVYALAGDAMRFALLALFLSVFAFGLWRLGRLAARARAAAAPPPPLTDPAPGGAPRADFDQLVSALAREPTRARVRAVRAALRERAQARDDETLADLMARRALPEASLGAALSAVERAAFCSEPQLAQAVREALPYLR